MLHIEELLAVFSGTGASVQHWHAKKALARNDTFAKGLCHVFEGMQVSGLRRSRSELQMAFQLPQISATHAFHRRLCDAESDM